MNGNRKTNRLGKETSPYLLQHAFNPVDWYPWGSEAFERARAENKPILLSIGYSSCHWCHVMERESFENPEIAALMNALFVNVKVDREERPDVDDVYMKAVQLLIGRGGWPLTVFLTPDGKPFHGGTYFPPTDRHGLPGFSRVLRAVADAFRTRADEVERASSSLVAGVRQHDEVASASEIDPNLPEAAVATLLQYVDRTNGGIGGAPKFPHASAFQLFLRHCASGGEPELLAVVRLTCERMAAGGMCDQIGGGFHRYAVDAHWLVPHFEKMLYDNAQLARLYLDAHQVTGDPGFRRVAERTLDYVLREMRDPDGGFYSATDADSEGEEGKFFVWTPTEVRAIVGEADAELVCRYWDMTEDGNFEGRNIPHVMRPLAEVAAEFERSAADAAAAIERARSLLYDARRGRIPPLRDEKILTAWNGLMISALSHGGWVLGEARYLDAASAAADFVWEALHPRDRLLHVWTRGVAKQSGFLDDHALFGMACLDLYETNPATRHLERALALADELDRYFLDGDVGGYFFTPLDGETLIARGKAGADGAVPSGNGMAALFHLRLHELTGEARYRSRAEDIIRLYHRASAEQPFGYVTCIEALERYVRTPTEVTILGTPDDPLMGALLDVVRRTYLPHRVVVRAAPGDPAAPVPARGRDLVGGRATAYVCHRFACAVPTNDPVQLGEQLAATLR